MATTWRACAIAALGLAMASACNVAPYACTDDAQCRLHGREGRCEDVGFCSYPDGACGSGARFSDHASAELAGSCVDGSLETSEGSDTGCTVDCPVPGETLWTLEPYEGQALAMTHVATRSIVVGASSSDGAGSVSFALAVDDEGELAWGPLTDHGPNEVRAARGVAGTREGDVWIVGDEDGSAGTRAWAQRRSIDGDLLEPRVFDTLVDDRFVTATRADVAIAAGATEGGAWLRALDDDPREHIVAAHTLIALAGRGDGTSAALLAPADGPLALHVFAPGGAPIAAGPSALAGATSIALARDGGVLLAGAGVLVRSDTAGAIAWSTMLMESVTVAAVLEHDDGDVSIAGTLGEGATRRPWLARCAPDGTLSWQRTIDEAAETTVIGAAPRDDGSIVIAGSRGVAPTVWIAAFGP